MSEPIPAPDELRRLHKSISATGELECQNRYGGRAAWSEQEAIAVAEAV